VQRQLAQGKGFRVRFPGEFVVRNSIEDSLRRLCFLIKLHQDGFCKIHNCSLRVCEVWYSDFCGCGNRRCRNLIATFFGKTFLTMKAVSPPVEATLPPIRTAAAMHAGHTCGSLRAALLSAPPPAQRPVFRLALSRVR
jgi:hypothetical protein